MTSMQFNAQSKKSEEKKRELLHATHIHSIQNEIVKVFIVKCRKVNRYLRYFTPTEYATFASY